MSTELKTTTQIEAKVREQLEKALRDGTPCELVINRYGEQETIAPGPPDPELDILDIMEDDGEDDAFRLVEELAHHAPTFGVCCALKGELLGHGNSISFDDLPRLIEDAEAERVRFYTEREKEFGPSAWPGGRRAS